AGLASRAGAGNMGSSRYPVEVKAVGVMQCQKQKNYMMFVSWSDRNSVLIYRTFEEFKRFHKELKRKFPIESGSLRRSDRTIPKFKDANVKQRKSGKLNKSLERLKLLETYSQELLKMDAKISQSETLIQFFKAQTQDLDPSFPENSVVIMPSEIGGERRKEQRRRQQQQQQHVPSITHPQASQSYRCIEAFETKDTKNKTFKVAKKEIVEVLIKDMTGWWLVENADKQIAWFPAPYLQQLDIHGESESASSSQEEGCLYFAARAYESQEADELSLNNGVIVEVVRKSQDGWWLSRYNGRTGYIPSMCLQPYRNPHCRLQSIVSCGLNASTPNLSSSYSSSSSSSLGAPQAPDEVQARPPHDKSQGGTSARSRSKTLPRASSTSHLESDSSSLSTGSEQGRPGWKADLCRSLPEVEQARSSAPGTASAPRDSKSPHLTQRDRNDSGFVEVCAADSSCSLADSDSAACVPKVPARPSAHEILQKCSTITKRAMQSASRAALLQSV
ncbi:NOXO1 oxidase, partial [Nothocercus nigrocapillus]|nr:NOXO1 oxidase [Nothocercus nigrocapillus]